MEEKSFTAKIKDGFLSCLYIVFWVSKLMHRVKTSFSACNSHLSHQFSLRCFRFNMSNNIHYFAPHIIQKYTLSCIYFHIPDYQRRAPFISGFHPLVVMLVLLACMFALTRLTLEAGEKCQGLACAKQLLYLCMPSALFSLVFLHSFTWNSDVQYLWLAREHCRPGDVRSTDTALGSKAHSVMHKVSCANDGKMKW